MKHSFKYLSNDRLEEHFSNFLRDSWSYSALAEFTSNPKAFEMRYIYNIPSTRPASSVAGNAYHLALQFYFDALQDGEEIDIVELQRLAFDYIDSFNIDKWRLQKTTPTIEACQTKATKIVDALLNNFFSEKSIYMDMIKEVLFVEVYLNEWVSINGVDIPLPCHSKIDLVIKTHEDKIVVIDHKSKSAFTDDEKQEYIIGQQAITYVNCLEAKYDIKVDEVCFIENKYSKNKDGSNQLKPIRVKLTKNTRRVYEYFLYEGLRNMMLALQDPDYVYPINYRDNFTDVNELFSFAADTILSEIDTIYVSDNKKELIEKRQKKIKDSSLKTMKIDAVKMVKKHAQEFIQYDLSNKDMTQGEKIEHTLRTLGISTKVEYIIEGYSSDTFLLEVTSGTKLSTLYKYRLDIARVLSVPNVRMMDDLFVYQDKSYFAIEATRKEARKLDYDKSLVEANKIPLGKNNFDEIILWDLENPSTPHILVCGATGSGKTIFLNSTLEYILESKAADRIVIYDRKHEFLPYAPNKKITVLPN